MKKAISALTVVAAALVVVAPATSKTLPQLFGTVGPSPSTFMLKNKAGATVRAVKAGKYTITVQDFSRAQNFHLVGPGLNVKTSLKRKGSSGWAVVLRAGTYRYYSDGSPTKLRGSFKVS